MMVGKTPPEVNTLLKNAGAFSSDLIISNKAAEALGLDYLGTSSTPAAWEPSIMEVDMSPSPGKQQHFVIRMKDKIIDPWTGTERPLNTYPLVSYRLFKNLNTNMEKTYRIKSDLRNELEKLWKDFDHEKASDHEKMAGKLENYMDEAELQATNIKALKEKNKNLQNVITTEKAMHKKEIASLKTMHEKYISELIEEQQKEIEIINDECCNELKDGLAYRWDGERFVAAVPLDDGGYKEVNSFSLGKWLIKIFTK